MGGVGRLVQGVDVVGRRVVGNSELSLGLVLVADVAHPQRGRERFVECAPSQFGEGVGGVAEKRTADRRGRTEQQRHQPSAAVEVAHQCEIPVGGEFTERFAVVALHRAKRGPEWPGQGEVEMHTGNDLHHAAVAVAEAAPVHVLHGAHVRAAVARDWNGAIAGDHAGHARRPQNLVADQRVCELVQVAQAA